MSYSNGRREKKKSTHLSTFTDLYYNINGCVAALHTRKRPNNFLQLFNFGIQTVCVCIQDIHYQYLSYLNVISM